MAMRRFSSIPRASYWKKLTVDICRESDKHQGNPTNRKKKQCFFAQEATFSGSFRECKEVT